MKFWQVTCKQGHQGKGRYQPIVFAIAANTIIDAMDHAKAMPGVKHQDMILGCEEISFKEYCDLRKVSAYERRLQF